MVDVTYTYYKEEFGGGLVKEPEFKKLLQTAKIYVSNRTFGASNKVNDTDDCAERLKFAICSVIDTISIHTDDSGMEHGAVASESVGGTWSRNYKVSDKGGTSLDDIVYDKLYHLLAGTGLLGGGAFK